MWRFRVLMSSWKPRGSGINRSTTDFWSIKVLPNHLIFLSFKPQYTDRKKPFSCLTVWSFKENLGLKHSKSIPLSRLKAPPGRPGWSPWKKEPLCHQWHFSSCLFLSALQLQPALQGLTHALSSVFLGTGFLATHRRCRTTGIKEFSLLSEKRGHQSSRKTVTN